MHKIKLKYVNDILGDDFMELPTHIVAAGGIIINEHDEVLLVKNPRKGWEYPGGIVESGETVIDGLKREIKEESGVNVKVLNVVGIYSNTKKKKGFNGVKVIPTIVTIDFICMYDSGELTLSDESNDVRWFTKEAAKKIINPRQQYRFKNALSYSGEIVCAGYEANEKHEIIIKQEYKFAR